MDHQIILIAVAAANLAVTIWLLWILIPVWRTLKEVLIAVDQYDFDRLARQFLGDEKPVSETIHVKMENKEEGCKEIIVTRAYKRPLDPKEIQENFVRQMAEKLQ